MFESIPGRLAELVSRRIDIPTIGIGAGVGCDGQVLVTHDLLGLFDRFTPRFVKRYADLHAVMAQAFLGYRQDVAARRFPAAEHTVDMPDETWQSLLARLGSG